MELPFLSAPASGARHSSSCRNTEASLSDRVDWILLSANWISPKEKAADFPFLFFFCFVCSELKRRFSTVCNRRLQNANEYLFLSREGEKREDVPSGIWRLGWCWSQRTQERGAGRARSQSLSYVLVCASDQKLEWGTCCTESCSSDNQGPGTYLEYCSLLSPTGERAHTASGTSQPLLLI